MSDWQQHPPATPSSGQYPGAPVAQPYGGQPHSGLGQPRATFLQRAVALVIDGLVISLATLVLMVPLGIVGYLGSSLEEQPCPPSSVNPAGICERPTGGTMVLWLFLFLALTVGQLLLSYVLLVRPVAKTGQTIGRRMLGIRVVDANTGQLLSTSRAFGRFLFAYFISGMCYIGYLWMLWDDNKQTLHDKVVDAVVVPA